MKDKSMKSESVNNGNLPSNYSDNCSQASSAFSQDIPPSANANLPNMLPDNSSSSDSSSNQDIPMPLISPVPQNATHQEPCHTSMDFNKLVPSSHFILDNWEGKKAIGSQTLGKVKNAVFWGNGNLTAWGLSIAAYIADSSQHRDWYGINQIQRACEEQGNILPTGIKGGIPWRFNQNKDVVYFKNITNEQDCWNFHQQIKLLHLNLAFDDLRKELDYGIIRNGKNFFSCLLGNKSAPWQLNETGKSNLECILSIPGLPKNIFLDGFEYKKTEKQLLKQMLKNLAEAGYFVCIIAKEKMPCSLFEMAYEADYWRKGKSSELDLCFRDCIASKSASRDMCTYRYTCHKEAIYWTYRIKMLHSAHLRDFVLTRVQQGQDISQIVKDINTRVIMPKPISVPTLRKYMALWNIRVYKKHRHYRKRGIQQWKDQSQELM